jgi:hypothetical protein
VAAWPSEGASAARPGGRAADVLGDLGALYAKFTESVEMPDLRTARSLLERRFDH